MNKLFFSMNIISALKKAAPVLAILVLVVTVLNLGSYNPYNELAVLAPESAKASSLATFGGLTVPTLTTPTLSTPTVNTVSVNTTVPSVTVPTLTTPDIQTPSVSVPEISTPDLSVPTLEAPTVTVPEVTVPSVTVPTLETPTLEVPEVTVPSLTVPSLTVPELTVPSVTVPTLTVPVLDTNTSTSIKTCKLTADTYTITTGSSITLSWTTQGYEQVTINGENQTSIASGSKTFDNILANTTYTLIAKNASGSECKTSVTVLCLPPVPTTPTCTELGYDFTAAKFTWNGSFYVKTAGAAGYDVAVAGNNIQASWTSNKVIMAVVAGTNSTYRTFPGGLSGTISKCDIGTGCYSIAALEFCANDEVVTPAPTCALTPATATIATGSNVNLAWSTTNSRLVTLTDFGTVTATGTVNTGALTADKNYTLTVVGLDGSTITCHSAIDVTSTPPSPAPSCDSFNATPTSVVRGNSATLTWVTSNGTTVAINNGVGTVTATGTYMVAPLATTEYLLTVFGTDNRQDTCTATVTVTDPEVIPAPQCNYLTATPDSLPVGGGNVTLSWATTNAATVSIAPVIGSVAASGSSTVALSATTNFVLTATTGTTTATCNVNVPVAVAPTPISCANNVNFTANPTSVLSGNSSTLTWSTNGITGVSFDNGITATGLSGSVTVAPTTGTTYNLTATNGTDSIVCPVTVAVTTSGGSSGGGSSSPRCEFSVSDNSISSGEKVVLTWDTSRATEVWIEDETNDTKLVTTEGLISSEKSKLYDGDITVSPKKDTTYVLTAKRGSKTRTCTVDVDIKDNVVVTQIRDQQPLVSGIALTAVPYTGFEAGPILTVLFYMLLLAWALYVAYLLVIRRDILGGLTLATPQTDRPRYIPEEIRPDVFVAQVKVPAMPESTITPANLPTAPVFGYANQVTQEIGEHSIDEETMTEIENYAHSKRVLISSDAIRHFIATTSTETERMTVLDQVINAAKAEFPAEDGWIVLNENRMADLCLVCAANAVQSSVAPYVPATIPEGAGSLAEAIVTGNVVAAYELIGHRPMFALADAAADLDAVYRIRRGEAATASELLMKETARLSDETILTVINALTSALDGTYTDEASAVKMAIMKAIKSVA